MDRKVPLIIFASAVLLPTPLLAFGITPGTVMNDRLLPGSIIEKKIFLTRNKADNPLDIEVKKIFPLGDSWISLAPSTIRFENNEIQTPVSILIQVPKNTPLNSYRGTIHFIEKQDEPAGGEQKNGNISLTGGTLNLNLQVTSTLVKDFSLLAIEPPQFVPPKPFLFWTIPGKISLPLVIENTGNTPVAPKKIEVNFYQGNTLRPLKTITTFNTETIQPFTIKKIIPTIRHKLPPREYTVGIKVFKDYRLSPGGEQYLTVKLPEKTNISPKIISFLKKIFRI